MERLRAAKSGGRRSGEGGGQPHRPGGQADTGPQARGRGNMTVFFDTKQVAPGDRAESVRETIWSAVVKVEIDHHPEPDEIVAVGAICSLGRLNICSVRATATTVPPTPNLAPHDLSPTPSL